MGCRRIEDMSRAHGKIQAGQAIVKFVIMSDESEARVNF